MRCPELTFLGYKRWQFNWFYPPFLNSGVWFKYWHCTHSLVLPDYTLIIGGYDGSSRLDTVEVVSQDTSTPVLDCMKNLGNFPTTIIGAVGTTFGMYRRAESEYHIWKISGNSYINFSGEVPHVCGGYDGQQYSNKCWKYEGMTDQWFQAST